jgi:hypothetical protein
MINKYLCIFFGFLLFLAWGVFSTGWYESARLQVKGTAERGKAGLALRWDSGAGLNEYESRTVLVNIPRLDGAAQQHIRIRALQEKHPDSASVNVSIIRIIIDGKDFDLKNVRARSIFHDRLALHLTPDQPVFEFDAPVKDHVRIVFANSSYFGKVVVEVNGISSTHDLYRASGRYDEKSYDYYLLQPDGTFQFAVELPRYRIKRLYLLNADPGYPVSFSAVSLCREDTCTLLPPDASSTTDTWFFRQPNRSLKHYFEPVRLSFRVLFALVNVWVLWQVVTLIRRDKGVIPFFLARDRRPFWGFALLFAVVNGAVFAPFWPGIMSPDSLAIWRASGLPDVYLNTHPILNQIFYMYLRGLWNHPAVVPVAQILASSLLVAAVFARILKSGVSLWLLVPLFLLLLLSIPIHLYNLALWKDIPFALLVTGWGCFFAFASRWRQDGGYYFSASQWVGLLLAYLLLGFFRHNALVYMVVVPFFWMLLSPVAWKKTLAVSLSALVLTGGLLWSMSQIRAFGGLEFLSTSLTAHTMFLKQTSWSQEVVRAGKGYLQVFDMNKEKTVSDKWHAYLDDRYAWNFLKETELADYYPYVDRQSSFPQLQKTVLAIYQASYESPWKYVIWNPWPMLLLVPCVLLGFRWFPSAAIFSGFLLCGVVPLLAINIFNWRYYYFFYFGLYFILPLMLLDRRQKRRRESLKYL